MAAKVNTWLTLVTTSGNATLIRAAAKRDGMSVSAWLTKVALAAAEKSRQRAA